MTQKSQITINIDPELFQRLQSLAVPLVDNTDTVIHKLLDYWESDQRAGVEAEPGNAGQWMTPRGEKFPVGTKLRARYNGEEFKAEVTRSGIAVEGETFTSPSAAAIHAKNLANVSGTSANTNGWKFWEFLDEAEQRWRSIRCFQLQAQLK